MSTTPTIYQRIDSHFRNKYARVTGYAYMSRGLSDALDVFCAIVGITPAQLGLWQGPWNDNGPATSKGFHGKANAADLVLPSSSKIDEWIKTMSYIGIGGWLRNRTHGGFSTPHFHVFCLFQRNTKYVARGIIDQQDDYLNNGDGMIGNGRDYHHDLRPDIRTVHFMGKAKSRNAVVTIDTHSYSQPGKLKAHQDAARKKGYKITNAVGIVRVWEGDKKTDMLVTTGLRFYDLAKVKWA